MKTRVKKILINLLITGVVGFVYFYAVLPPINLHAREFYAFAGLVLVTYCVCTLVTSGPQVVTDAHGYIDFVKSQCRVPLIIAAALAVIFLIGGLLSLVIFRTGAYRSLIDVRRGDFAADVAEISLDQIPMLDKDSAERLGDRKLGELSDMVSQFEVSNDYTQINYQDRPVRVTPLEYGDLIKWFNNRKGGLPAYMIIDMATQAVEVVRLDEGIKYSPTELFGRNLARYLRFQYPTFMFDEPVFEIDEAGHPYWVCPKLEMTIGLFGGRDINGAVLVDAVTGECAYYKKDDVPNWVDRVYTAELIIEQYNYYGMYQNGYLNSIFGQKGVTVATQGYNYIAQNDDVYVYTGITSVGGDQSNIGFILSNQRTKETAYYPVAGAAEYSAAASAEGVVQHLNYKATFPLLLNIASQPTYFLSLKDNAELVKMYAMVNVQQYQIVATGTSVEECEKQYKELLAQNNITPAETPREATVTGKIHEIRTAVKNGNSYYYFALEGSENIFYSISAASDDAVVALDTGDTVKIVYHELDDKIIRGAYSVTLVKKGVRAAA